MYYGNPIHSQNYCHQDQYKSKPTFICFFNQYKLLLYALSIYFQPSYDYSPPLPKKSCDHSKGYENLKWNTILL